MYGKNAKPAEESNNGSKLASVFSGCSFGLAKETPIFEQSIFKVQRNQPNSDELIWPSDLFVKPTKLTALRPTDKQVQTWSPLTPTRRP